MFGICAGWADGSGLLRRSELLADHAPYRSAAGNPHGFPSSEQFFDQYAEGYFFGIQYHGHGDVLPDPAHCWQELSVHGHVSDGRSGLSDLLNDPDMAAEMGRKEAEFLQRGEEVIL